MSTRPFRPAITVGLALLVAATGCTLPGAKQGPMKLTAVFDDVGDLVVDHSVQVADVRVGSITKIELTNDYRAKVTMSVEDLDLPADAVAELRSTSLLGEKFIQLRPCDPKSDFTTATNGARQPACTGTSDRLARGQEIKTTKVAPELEFVADQAVRLLGGVAVNDLTTLIETGSVGFGGRVNELRSLITDLGTISATLADQSDHIGSIIDGLDKATTTLAASDADVNQLLINLSQTTTVLATQRDHLIDTVKAITRLAQDENRMVFDPYLEQVNRQVKELDAILDEIARGRSEVANLLDWAERFLIQIPIGVPHRGDGTEPAPAYAQVYGWFAVCPTSGC